MFTQGDLLGAFNLERVIVLVKANSFLDLLHCNTISFSHLEALSKLLKTNLSVQLNCNDLSPDFSSTSRRLLKAAPVKWQPFDNYSFISNPAHYLR